MDEKMISARVLDLVRNCARNNSPCFSAFLSPEESALAEMSLRGCGVENRFFGGYENAERVMLCVCPFSVEDNAFPLCALTFSYGAQYKLCHRDFLGALMSLGMERDCVGDILVEKGRAVVFVKREMVKFIKLNLSVVGRTGVTVTDGFTMPLPELSGVQNLSSTVSSMRLDCVLAAICNLSRSGAVALIEEKAVSIGGVLCRKSDMTVCEGDKISVRHKGKFAVVSCGDLSKKGRIILKYIRYI